MPTDLPFLRGERELMETYLAAFGDAVPAALAEQVRAAALRFGLPYGRDASDGAGERVQVGRVVTEAGTGV